MSGLAILAIIAWGLAQPAWPQRIHYDRKAIAYAKGILVGRLDRSLPAQRLDQWLRNELGSGVRISWEANDCGEQTGGLADGSRDIPSCVEAAAPLSNGRTLQISIAVGTLRKGISGRPTVESIVIQQGSSSTDLDKLGKLSAMLGGKSN